MYIYTYIYTYILYVFYLYIYLCIYTTKSIFTSIIWFSEILSFLLGDSSSISSTLNEDNEGVWETENVSLLVTNVAVAVVFKLPFFDSLSAVEKLILVFTLFKSCNCKKDS